MHECKRELSIPIAIHWEERLDSTVLGLRANQARAFWCTEPEPLPFSYCRKFLSHQVRYRNGTLIYTVRTLFHFYTTVPNLTTEFLSTVIFHWDDGRRVPFIRKI